MRHTFAVGRLDAGKRELVWVRPRPDPTFPGPWTVRAVVGPCDSLRGGEPVTHGSVAPTSRRRRAEGEAPGSTPAPDRPQLDLFR